MISENYLASLPDMGGRITVESVAECSWNRWPNHRGLGGRMIVEYAGMWVCVIKLDVFLNLT